MMEVVVTTGAVRRAKLQSDHHHQQSKKLSNIQHFTGHTLFLSRNQQCHSEHWREEHHIPWTCSPETHWGLPTWLPWGREGCEASC